MTKGERMSGIGDVVHELKIENCPDVCERAKWYRDPLTDVFNDGRERGQYNCPYHFGVTYQAAIINGKPLCKHLKRKVDE